MFARALALGAFAFALGGCGGGPPITYDVGVDHPANSRAAEAPAPALSTTLANEVQDGGATSRPGAGASHRTATMPSEGGRP